LIEELFQDAQKRMTGAVSAMKDEFAGVRTGRANPALLERVQVDYYGTPTPVNQLATISVPEPRLLVIQPWDKSAIKNIEKAILQSELGFNPTNDGNVIRVVVPQLTEERRKELVRLVRKMAEEHRVAVRNIRRDLIEEIKALEKEGEVSEDESRRAQSRAQELTDKYIGEIDRLLEQKESEIMEV